MQKRLQNLKESLNLEWGELAKHLGVSRAMLDFCRKGERKAGPKFMRRIVDAEAALASQKPSWEKHLVKVTAVPIYGYAQAMSLRCHKGDLIPDQVSELPTIPVPEDGRRYAAFRVEGESMAPVITDGSVVLADPDRELTPRCVVVAKWDDTITIKRYSREQDMIYLKSDNPAEGENYKVHAKDIDWILRIVFVRTEV